MYTLTVWTNENEPRQFTAATPSLVLRALRQWLNGGECDDHLPLKMLDCTGTHDVVLGWSDDFSKWYVRWGNSINRYFAEWGEAREAFVDACSYRVADLDARCRCADCKRLMVRAYAPWVPGRGWVCFDCLVYYVGCPIRLPNPITEEGI